MEDLLPLNWYIDPPIDFEHKQYLLFGYLQRVDSSYLNKKVSPHLLNLQKLERELLHFNSSFEEIKKSFEKNRYLYFDNPKLEGEKNLLVEEIREIVEFSIPQIHSRIETGQRIFQRYKQILY